MKTLNLLGKSYGILFGKNFIGDGEPELGKILIKSFIYSLLSLESKPSFMVFLNSGAKLTSKDSTVLDDLKELEKLGIEMLTCGTCINYYELDEIPAVGKRVDMVKITTVLSQSTNVITI